MTAGPGTMVECIRNDFAPIFYQETIPIKGNIYTIRDVYTEDNGSFIRLEEIINPQYEYLYGFDECGFDIQAFRPITDISALREIVTDVFSKELV